MTILYLFPACLSLLIMAAHFLRDGNIVVMMTLLMMPFLLLIPRAWTARTIQFTLILSALEWLRTLWTLAAERQSIGQPWTRMAIVLGSVTLFTFGSAMVFAIPTLRRRYSGQPSTDADKPQAFTDGNLDNNPAAAKFARP